MLAPWPMVPARQEVRSRAECSGAATMKPHEAMAVVRNDDCWRKPQKPWLNSTSGNGRLSGSAAGRSVNASVVKTMSLAAATLACSAGGR